MTTQTPEKLLYNNRLGITYDHPLSDIIHSQYYCIEYSHGMSTACRQGYEGYWEIFDNSLWLVGLFSVITSAKMGTAGGDHEFTNWLYFNKGTLIRRRRIDNRLKFRHWFGKVSSHNPEWAKWLANGMEGDRMLAWHIAAAGYETLGLDVPRNIDSHESVTNVALPDIGEEHGEWILLQQFKRPVYDLASID